jgi:hypothetical protein
MRIRLVLNISLENHILHNKHMSCEALSQHFVADKAFLKSSKMVQGIHKMW